MTNVAAEIKQYLQEEVIEPGLASDLDDDTQIWEEELIDSMGIMMLIAHIEDEYGVDIDVDDVDVEHFQSVRTITALIEAKRG